MVGRPSRLFLLCPKRDMHRWEGSAMDLRLANPVRSGRKQPHRYPGPGRPSGLPPATAPPEDGRTAGQ